MLALQDVRRNLSYIRGTNPRWHRGTQRHFPAFQQRHPCRPASVLRNLFDCAAAKNKTKCDLCVHVASLSFDALRMLLLCLDFHLERRDLHIYGGSSYIWWYGSVFWGIPSSPQSRWKALKLEGHPSRPFHMEIWKVWVSNKDPVQSRYLQTTTPTEITSILSSVGQCNMEIYPSNKFKWLGHLW